jgi:hypothetical protein
MEADPAADVPGSAGDAIAPSYLGGMARRSRTASTAARIAPPATAAWIVPGRLCPRAREPRTAFIERSDINDERAEKERIAPNENAEPIDRIEPAEPTLPTESTEPTLPIDSTDPRDPMHSTESCDQRDNLELPLETAMR